MSLELLFLKEITPGGTVPKYMYLHIKGFLNLGRKKSVIYSFNISDDPSHDEKIKGDPHRTIFVAQLVGDFRVRNTCSYVLSGSVSPIRQFYVT